MSHYIVNTWGEVKALLDSLPEGNALRIPKQQLSHPTDEGARESIGMPEGQKGDYRFRLQDCRCLHVRVFDDYYEAHIDKVDPECSLMEHLRQDAPGSYTLSTGGIGALIGLIVGKNKEAMLLGGLIGLLVGAATLPEDEKKPKTT